MKQSELDANRSGFAAQPHLENDGRALYYEIHGEGEPLLCVERAEELNALVLDFLAGVGGSAEEPTPASTGS
jgi:hypothetical protein